MKYRSTSTIEYECLILIDQKYENQSIKTIQWKLQYKEIFYLYKENDLSAFDYFINSR